MVKCFVLIKVNALILQVSRITVAIGLAGSTVVALADDFIVCPVFTNILLAFT